MADEVENIFLIYLIDYGTKESVHLKDLCRILPRFSHLPAQSLEVFLNGIDHKSNLREGMEALGKGSSFLCLRRQQQLTRLLWLLILQMLNVYLGTLEG